ncbi:MAG: ATP-binding protein, partial [Candidatus Omnitrophica bacterium]|nr:ATP-binding protein [Candidatus Omnitrophota bacterium]
MQTILANMVEGVIAVDVDTKIMSWNPAAEKIFGILKNEAEGRFFLEVVRNSDINMVINKILENKEFISQEITLIWPLQKIFQLNVSPIFENDKIKGCVLVIHDITELRRLENIRRDFVANASHELKTPLTSIKGFVETLEEGALEDKEHARHFLKIIEEHTNRLDNLINDLLSLSHLESGKIILSKGNLNLKTLTEEVIQGFGSQLKKRSIGIDNELHGLLVMADYAKIGQVMTNLIDNAIKFNRDEGSIKIYSQELQGSIKVIVDDSGMGIPAKDIPRIFERFYRVDKARSRELGGTGLGLSIVKHIVELHGGSVGLESTEGLGSQFWFTLPK